MTALSILISILMASSKAQPNSPSEAYQKYVDQMIPLSFEYSKVRAGLQEHDVFINIVSAAQTELAQTSEILNQVAQDAQSLMKIIPPTSSFEHCPKDTSGNVSNTIIFKNFSAMNQLKEGIRKIETGLNHYRKIKDQLSYSCRGPFSRSFSIENDLAVLTPEIHQWDGTYVSVGNLTQTLIEIGETILNLFSNQSEQSKINGEKERFERSRAKDTDFILYSEEACQAEAEMTKLAFANFEAYYHAAQSLISSIKNIEWERLSNFWRFCLQIDEAEKIKAWIKGAEIEVRQQSSQNDSPLLTQILKIRLRGDTTRTASRWNNQCDPSTLKELKSRLASFRLFGMQAEPLFIKITEIVHQIEIHCRGEIQ